MILTQKEYEQKVMEEYELMRVDVLNSFKRVANATGDQTGRSGVIVTHAYVKLLASAMLLSMNDAEKQKSLLQEMVKFAQHELKSHIDDIIKTFNISDDRQVRINHDL